MIPAKEIYKSLQEVALSCETIEPHRCDECPLYEEGCLEEVTFLGVVHRLNEEKVRQMIELADEITEEQIEAEKTEEERRWEAEAEIGNLMRSDPDWD